MRSRGAGQGERSSAISRRSNTRHRLACSRSEALCSETRYSIIPSSERGRERSVSRLGSSRCIESSTHRARQDTSTDHVEEASRSPTRKSRHSLFLAQNRYQCGDEQHAIACSATYCRDAQKCEQQSLLRDRNSDIEKSSPPRGRLIMMPGSAMYRKPKAHCEISWVLAGHSGLPDELW